MNFISEKDIGSQGDAPKTDEPIDNRPLYNRLKEVRDKKQLEYEEAHKLKNQFRGIDEDEADFLRMVDVSKSEAESQRKREENDLIRKTIAIAPPIPSADALPAVIRPKVPATKAVNKQASLLAGAIRKRPHSDEVTNPPAAAQSASESAQKQAKLNDAAPPVQTLRRVLGVLPGLASYQDSSDSNSDKSSDSENGGGEFSVSSLTKKSAGGQQAAADQNFAGGTCSGRS